VIRFCWRKNQNAARTSGQVIGLEVAGLIDGLFGQHGLLRVIVGVLRDEGVAVDVQPHRRPSRMISDTLGPGPRTVMGLLEPWGLPLPAEVFAILTAFAVSVARSGKVNDEGSRASLGSSGVISSRSLIVTVSPVMRSRALTT
jgi:hypothetical protein